MKIKRILRGFPSPTKPGEHIQKLNGAHDTVCKGSDERKVPKRAPLNFVLYDFRHTFATRLAEAGVDQATLAAILGHNSLRIGQKYVHPTAEHKRNAMERYEGVLAALGRQQPGSTTGSPN